MILGAAKRAAIVVILVVVGSITTTPAKTQIVENLARAEYFVIGDYPADFRAYNGLRWSLRHTQRPHYIFINSNGGYSTSAEPTIRSIRNTRNNVVCEVRKAYSYGALTAMRCGVIKINYRSSWMFHEISPADIFRNEFKAEIRDYARLMFTQHEYSRLFNNKRGEVWFRGVHVCERLKSRMIKRGKDYCLVRGFK